MRRVLLPTVLALASGCADDVEVATHPRLEVGHDHACRLGEDGDLRCWGETIWQVPVDWAGPPGVRYVVPPVATAGPVADIAVGDGSLCALSRDGEAWCWGLDPRDHPMIIDDVGAGASGVDLDEPLVDIATGRRFACGVTQSGAVSCWGDNNAGALGLGHADDPWQHEVAQLAAVDLPVAATEVVAGGSTVCARTADEALYCWGRGVHEPTRVDLPVPTRAVAVWGRDVCAVDDVGALRCWDHRWIDEPDMAEGPSRIPLPAAVLEVTIAGGHACARLADGTTRCWGQNEVGQLGLGHTSPVLDGATALLPARAAIVRIDAGAGGQTCAELDDATVRCWGHTVRWDGTTDADCMVEVPNPAAGAICEPATIDEFQCAADSRCCLGDDELATEVRPVPL